ERIRPSALAGADFGMAEQLRPLSAQREMGRTDPVTLSNLRGRVSAGPPNVLRLRPGAPSGERRIHPTPTDRVRGSCRRSPSPKPNPGPYIGAALSGNADQVPLVQQLRQLHGVGR